MSYMIAEGHGVALMSLADIDPQPASAGAKATRRTYSADGAVHDEGLYIALEWSVVESATALDDLFDQFGLDSATTAAVTIYCPNQLHAFTRYNGTAVRPEVGRNNYFLRDIVIIVKELTAL